MGNFRIDLVTEVQNSCLKKDEMGEYAFNGYLNILKNMSIKYLVNLLSNCIMDSK